jgi:hypothetical protein
VETFSLRRRAGIGRVRIPSLVATVRALVADNKDSWETQRASPQILNLPSFSAYRSRCLSKNALTSAKCSILSGASGANRY